MTLLIPVISVEEQMGKTTETIRIGKSCQEKENNIFLTHAQTHIKNDLINKATGHLKNIVDRKSIGSLCTSYTKGIPVNYNFVDLQNETVLKELAKLTRWQKMRPINFFSDEGDGMGLGEHAKDYRGNFVQKDHCLFNLYESGLINKMYLISATWWDWLWQSLPFQPAIVINKYEGFKGFEDTVFIEREKDYFEAVRTALNKGKPVPEQFLADLQSFPNTLIDIDTNVDTHRVLTELYPEIMGQLNYQKQQLDKQIIVGGHKLSRAMSVGQNCSFFSRRSYGNRAELNQHLGRVNGLLTPILIAEPEVIKYRKEDYAFKKRAIEERVFDKSIDDRIAWAESQNIYNPFNFPSPKAKKNRKITASRSNITSEKGTTKTLVETRVEVWGGNDSKKYWTDPSTFKGTEPGRLIKKALKEQHDHIDIDGLSYKTMMSKQEFTKFRNDSKREAEVRAGKIPSREGWFYVHILIEEYYDGCSVYNEEGNIVVYSTNPSTIGQIKKK